MPLRRLPSLTALRAFEAAARLNSFKAAAHELSVTPGAISQHIRALEEDLGVALFHREARAVTLTRAGAALCPDISDSFLQMRQAVDRVCPTQNRVLRINATAPMISKFLLPRIPRFAAAHPDIDVQIETEQELNPMRPDGPAVALRVTRTPPDHLYSKLLFHERLMPVASPGLVERLGLYAPEDIARSPILEDKSLSVFRGVPGWAEWFRAARVPAPERFSSFTFERGAPDYVLDMAISGNGVMLSRTSICHAALAAGLLASPFGPVLTTDVGIYLLCRPEIKSEPHIRIFFEWLQGEAAMVTTLYSLHCVS